MQKPPIVICRIGSLEILRAYEQELEDVICRIGSLETHVASEISP